MGDGRAYSVAVALAGDIPVSQVVTAYLDHLAVERGTARNTLDSYARTIQHIQSNANPANLPIHPVNPAGPRNPGPGLGVLPGQASNEWIVVVLYVWPGRSTVEGNDGWFGESGKCCVSRHSASP